MYGFFSSYNQTIVRMNKSLRNEKTEQTYCSWIPRIGNSSRRARPTTEPPFFRIRGRFDQTTFFCTRGVIVPPSKLIVTIIFPPRGGFLLGGVSYEGGRSNQKSFLMRGVIVPPYKLIVTNICSPQVSFFFY